MPRALTLLLLIAAPALTACAGSPPGGVGYIPPPDGSLTSPCERPEAHLGERDWEIIAGRIGDALIECGAEKAALVGYLERLRGGVAGRR